MSAFEITADKKQQIAVAHELFLKYHKADPKPLGFVSSYQYGDNYTKGMSSTPTYERQRPVYASMSHKQLTTIEWQNDPRTQELFAIIRVQDAMLKVGGGQIMACPQSLKQQGG
jgi:hypothetical protein